jgi:hypothetical protein
VLGLDWVMSKGFDASAPMGPLITPAAFAGDPDDLAIRLWVNDALRQDARTAGMVFDVATVISHLSTVMTLEPGDVIATGTPAGVGMGRTPPSYLRAGDIVRAEVEGLGTLTTPITSPVSPTTSDSPPTADRLSPSDHEPTTGGSCVHRQSRAPGQPAGRHAATPSDARRRLARTGDEGEQRPAVRPEHLLLRRHRARQ